MAIGRTNAGGGGTKFATGTIIPTSNSYTLTVSGLPFRPKKIMAMPAVASGDSISANYNCFILYDEDNAINEVGCATSSDSVYIFVSSSAFTITAGSFTVDTTGNGTRFTSTQTWRWYITN